MPDETDGDRAPHKPAQVHESQTRLRAAAARGREERIIVMANRGPLRPGPAGWQRSPGGLVTALDPVLRQRGGAWVSGDGVEGDPLPDLGYALPHATLSETVRRDFYQQFSNGVLWPVLHGFPATISLASAPYDAYLEANRAFVEAALEAADHDDLFWIQDYHLMLAPRLLREQRPEARIGWFCHIPWPAADHFATLPWAASLLEGLLESDVIGFHTAGYAKNFLDCVERLARIEVDRTRGLVTTTHGTTTVIAAPIGIPLRRVEALAASEEVNAHRDALRADMCGRRLLLGVDRLDYTKGVPARLRAFERLLERDPARAEELVLVQLVVPSREGVAGYMDLRDEIERLVSHINGRFGRPGCMPVHYLYRSLPPEQLYGYYRAADVALVTPLRDGMNLVAQEYVAAQTEEHGALVLSELAGAARLLHDAFLVNPYDERGMVETLEEVLCASPASLRKRMRRLRAQVRQLDVHRWASRFLAAIRQGGFRGTSTTSDALYA